MCHFKPDRIVLKAGGVKISSAQIPKQGYPGFDNLRRPSSQPRSGTVAGATSSTRSETGLVGKGCEVLSSLTFDSCVLPAQLIGSMIHGLKS